MTAKKQKAVEEVLRAVQSELHVPKGQKNEFGNYRYRSAEDICQAIKPLIAQHGFTLTTPTEVVQFGDRIYVKATARFVVGGDMIEVTAHAREPFARKGMDESQITGSAHSYAVKYALQALFLLDNNQDPDTQPPVNRHEVTRKQLGDLMRSWAATCAEGETDKESLKHGFAHFARSVAGPFDAHDVSCWTWEAFQACRERVEQTKEVAGVSGDVPFEE